MSLFKKHTATEHAKSIASYLPIGKLYNAKNIDGTNLKNLLIGLGSEFLRIENKMNEIADEHDVNLAKNLISEWESAVGIPDDCFIVEDNLADRIINVLLKLKADGTSTEQHFIDLALILGIAITIDNGFYVTIWPWTWPHVWGGTDKERRFTLIITFVGVTSPSSWPWTWPHVWTIDPVNILKCLFQKLKPANVLLSFRYE